MRRNVLFVGLMGSLMLTMPSFPVQAQVLPPGAGDIVDTLTGGGQRREREKERAYEQGRREAEREQQIRREERRRMRAREGMEDDDGARRVDRRRGPERCRMVSRTYVDRNGDRVTREREVCGQ